MFPSQVYLESQKLRTRIILLFWLMHLSDCVQRWVTYHCWFLCGWTQGCSGLGTHTGSPWNICVHFFPLGEAGSPGSAEGSMNTDHFVKTAHHHPGSEPSICSAGSTRSSVSRSSPGSLWKIHSGLSFLCFTKSVSTVPLLSVFQIFINVSHPLLPLFLFTFGVYTSLLSFQ